MFNNIKLTILLITLSVFSGSCDTEHYKCCTRNEWEGTMHLDAAASMPFFGLAWYNATVHFAYSLPLKKMYLGFRQTMVSIPLFPEPLHIVEIWLYDFNERIMYDVSSLDDYNCTKHTIDPSVTKLEQCIPGNATLVTRSSLGDSRNTTLSTYHYTTSTASGFYLTTATVHETDTETSTEKICDPVHVTFNTNIYETFGEMYGLDIFDIRPLKSKEIFNVPKKCLP